MRENCWQGVAHLRNGLEQKQAFWEQYSQKRKFSIRSERAGKRYIEAKTPINSKVAILFASPLFVSRDGPANGIN